MKKKAFVVGANKEKLKYAVQDAKNIVDAFSTAGYIVNTNEVSNFSSGDFLSALKVFVDDLLPDDLFIFYFVGHSFLGKNNALVFCIESSDINDVKSCIGAQEISYVVQQCGAKDKVVILDSCHSSAIVNEINLGYRNVNYAVICAAEPNETTPELWAYPEAQINGGFLSHHIYFALTGQAPDALNNGVLSFYSLMLWLDQRVKLYSIYKVSPVREINTIKGNIIVMENSGTELEDGHVQHLMSYSEKRTSKRNSRKSSSYALKFKVYNGKLEDYQNRFNSMDEELGVLREAHYLEMDEERQLQLQRKIESKQKNIFRIIEKIGDIEKAIDNL